MTEKREINMLKSIAHSWIAVIAATALGLAATAPAGAQEGPADVINGAVEALKTGLGEQRDTLADDRAALIAFVDDLLAPRFDRNYAGRLVLARH